MASPTWDDLYGEGAKAREKAEQDAITQQTTLTDDEAAKLEGMSRDELLVLCRRFACQCGLVAMMTKEEIAQAMRDVLAETALRPIVAGVNMKADIMSRLAAIDKWMDRTEGKAAQSVKIEQTNVNVAIEVTRDDVANIIEGWKTKHLTIENAS